MFGIGGFELFIILIFGFLIFGPDKLPEIAKTVGKGIARFREAQQEVNETINAEKIFDPDNPDEPFKDPTVVLDKLAQKQEEKKAAKAEESKKAEEKAEGEAKQESFTERKARYERERAARKAAEKEAAEGGEDAKADKSADAPVEEASESVDASEASVSEGGDA